MALNITSLVLQVVISWIVMAPALWIVGRWRVGPQKAKFTDALWISGLSTVLGAVIGAFISSGLLGWILGATVTLFLIRKYYETDWGNAIVISIASWLLVVIIVIAVGALGITLLS